ncbi:MAG: hypothetical protein K1Y02_06255 [Candidatus Hydrogenedentes bacterium]|nr:hypothetical protein [Candidatus Hydrogenedentota bacterium]
METARIAKPFPGPKLYQRRAESALPLLVRQAQAQSTVFYSALAPELGMTNPRNLNYVLGSVGSALEQLSDKWKENIPPIQCLVINKLEELPGEGVAWFISKKEDFRKLSLKQRREILRIELQKTFAYPKWYEVLNAFGLKPAVVDFTEPIRGAGKYHGGPESDEHKEMKRFIATHPQAVGLGNIGHGTNEYELPSGDLLDVSFQATDFWYAVEVKTKKAPYSDLVRGIFQCIKYKAVIEAVQASRLLPQNCRVILAIEGHLPSDLLALKNMLEVDVLERIDFRNG